MATGVAARAVTSRAPMLAVATVATVAAGLFGLLSLFGADTGTSAQVASFPLALVSLAHTIFERRELERRIPEKADRLPELGNYFAPWWRSALFGTLIMAGAMQLGSFLGSTIAAAFDPEQYLGGAVAGSWLAALAAAYLIGRRVGARCRAAGVALAATLTAMVAGAILAGSADFVLSDAAFEQVTGVPKSWGFFLGSLAIRAVPLLPVAAVGVWRGRRQEAARYLGYLFSFLDEGTRQAMIGLSYDEAVRLSRPA